MGQQVIAGALAKCSEGKAPGSLVVLPEKMVMCGGKPAATITDIKPFANIPFFGKCSGGLHPLNILGLPAPCIPTPAGPWISGALTVMIGNIPALNKSSKCPCSYGGQVEIVMPGQVNTQIP
jgi:Domain of unknown function (DUF4280)